jgi:hypothetical protein
MTDYVSHKIEHSYPWVIKVDAVNDTESDSLRTYAKVVPPLLSH